MGINPKNNFLDHEARVDLSLLRHSDFTHRTLSSFSHHSFSISAPTQSRGQDTYPAHHMLRWLSPQVALSSQSGESCEGDIWAANSQGIGTRHGARTRGTGTDGNVCHGRAPAPNTSVAVGTEGTECGGLWPRPPRGGDREHNAELFT